MLYGRDRTRELLITSDCFNNRMLERQSCYVEHEIELGLNTNAVYYLDPHPVSDVVTLLRINSDNYSASDGYVVKKRVAENVTGTVLLESRLTANGAKVTNDLLFDVYHGIDEDLATLTIDNVYKEYFGLEYRGLDNHLVNVISPGERFLFHIYNTGVKRSYIIHIIFYFIPREPNLNKYYPINRYNVKKGKF